MHTDNTHIEENLTLEARIQKHTEEILQNAELFVVAVVVRGRKGSRVVEVYVDGDNGIGVKDLSRISRELSFIFDAEDLIKGKYHLNVSSPGEERALRLERQYQRHVGKKLDLLVVDENASNPVEGENLGVVDGVLRIKSSSETMEIPLDRISRAQIKLPW